MTENLNGNTSPDDKAAKKKKTLSVEPVTGYPTVGESPSGPYPSKTEGDSAAAAADTAKIAIPAELAGGPHKLENGWALWEHRTPSPGSKSYEDNMCKLAEFDSIESFWCLFNNVPKPSQIFFDGQTKKKFVDRNIESFSLFKKGIKPEWEDVANRSGGEWFCRKTMDLAELDEFWLNLVLSMIGETMDKGDEITGARVVDKTQKGRAMYRLELWFRTNNMTIAEEIKVQMLKVLGKRAPTFTHRPHGGT